MKTPAFTGTCTALVTPFQADGRIAYDTLSAQIERQIAAGVDALCICGTTGESATLALEEHMAVSEFCIQEVAGRCKVLAGAGSNDTDAALALSLHAQRAGADALLLVTPYYNKTSQEGLYRHYWHIAERVDCPLILYNVPARTGISFTAETYQRLSAHPNINGIKEASGDFTLIANTLALCGNEIHLWCGNDDHTVPMLSLGAKGLISVAANLIPDVMRELTHSYFEGRHAEAASLQLRYTRLIDALFFEVNPIPIKTALMELGLDSGALRMPLWELSPEGRYYLLREMKAVGLIDP